MPGFAPLHPGLRAYCLRTGHDADNACQPQPPIQATPWKLLAQGLNMLSD
jgi:hypothetical protein